MKTGVLFSGGEDIRKAVKKYEIGGIVAGATASNSNFKNSKNL